MKHASEFLEREAAWRRKWTRSPLVESALVAYASVAVIKGFASAISLVGIASPSSLIAGLPFHLWIASMYGMLAMQAVGAALAAWLGGASRIGRDRARELLLTRVPEREIWNAMIRPAVRVAVAMALIGGAVNLVFLFLDTAGLVRSRFILHGIYNASFLESMLDALEWWLGPIAKALFEAVVLSALGIFSTSLLFPSRGKRELMAAIAVCAIILLGIPYTVYALWIDAGLYRVAVPDGILPFQVLRILICPAIIGGVSLSLAWRGWRRLNDRGRDLAVNGS